MYSVYGLVDPRNGQVRYIGIAEDIHRRYAQHLLYPHRNVAKNEWLAELKDAGLIPSLITIEAEIDEYRISDRERYWIEHYLAEGAQLTNIIHAPVGDGTSKDNPTIRGLRKDARLTMQELAHMARVTLTTLSRVERGLPVRRLTVGKIVRALNERTGLNVNIRDIEGVQLTDEPKAEQEATNS